MVVLKKI